MNQNNVYCIPNTFLLTQDIEFEEDNYTAQLKINSGNYSMD